MFAKLVERLNDAAALASKPVLVADIVDIFVDTVFNAVVSASMAVCAVACVVTVEAFTPKLLSEIARLLMVVCETVPPVMPL